MLVGYMRVSKADGSKSTDLQRRALLIAGEAADAYENAPLFAPTVAGRDFLARQAWRNRRRHPLK